MPFWYVDSRAQRMLQAKEIFDDEERKDEESSGFLKDLMSKWQRR
jgi:hypothetical protein